MPNKTPINIPDAKIIFRNFAGKKTLYSPAGRRTFNLLLPIEDAKQMEADGWNIKWPQPREDGVQLLPRTEIRVEFGNYPPKIQVITSRNRRNLTERNVAELDVAEIAKIDLVISPSFWDVNGKQGIKGYLKAMYVTLVEDEFEKLYEDIPMFDEPIIDDPED